jgi:Bacterial regulatory proteins, luxR family
VRTTSGAIATPRRPRPHHTEIADRLFLSSRTVASHLYRSYPKLGIAGRHQLRDLMRPAPQSHGRESP